MGVTNPDCDGLAGVRRVAALLAFAIRPLLRGQLGRVMIAVTALEIGNCATTC